MCPEHHQPKKIQQRNRGVCVLTLFCTIYTISTFSCEIGGSYQFPGGSFPIKFASNYRPIHLAVVFTFLLWKLSSERLTALLQPIPSNHLKTVRAGMRNNGTFNQRLGWDIQPEPALLTAAFSILTMWLVVYWYSNTAYCSIFSTSTSIYCKKSARQNSSVLRIKCLHDNR